MTTSASPSVQPCLSTSVDHVISVWLPEMVPIEASVPDSANWIVLKPA